MLKSPIKFLFIVMAGETIFMLPFLIPRLYRPLILEAWNLSNTDIGAAFSAYGIVAMFSYLLGGSFADKYPPRNLMVTSLIATALGGLTLLAFPSRIILVSTYAYFGFSTTFLMWSALIRVTHDIGGEENRSSAMGLLDSGRGLIAALISTLLVTLLDSSVDLADKMIPTKKVYLIVTCFTFLISIGVWFSLKGFVSKAVEAHEWSIDKAKKQLFNLDVWLLGIIILAAYCGYKSVDNYSIYLVDIHKRTLEESARFTSILFWVRPIAALITGFSIDKLHGKNANSRFLTLILLLGLSCIIQFLLALGVINNLTVILLTIIMTSAFAYALRAVYFSIFGELKIPEALIGTTVGIVSLVGFLPDMFFGLITGQLIDNYPGSQGYTYTFAFTGSLLLLGTVASIVLLKRKA